MNSPDFIGVYDNVLSLQECDKLISFFESSPKKEGGFYAVSYTHLRAHET